MGVHTGQCHAALIDLDLAGGQLGDAEDSRVGLCTPGRIRLRAGFKMDCKRQAPKGREATGEVTKVYTGGAKMT